MPAIRITKPAIPPVILQLTAPIRRLPNFLLAIIGVIILTLILTITSVAIYVSSGVSSIDLSRPGYEQIRGQLIDSDTNRTFSSDGPVDAASLKEFNELYDSQLKELQALGTYSESSIDDTNLGIAPAQPAEPPASP
jgi:hypothetical protein